ncbi:MAG: hypothetical protein KDK65_05220, partial [Chlamydiia bacterium]|nr:hypothetical protein [Chlamydiia bacterium]
LVEQRGIKQTKICGSFIAPEEVPTLKQWGVNDLHPISLLKKKKKKPYTFLFPKPAASLSRENLEKQLATRAQDLGCTLTDQTADPPTFVATGKRGPTAPYFGFKGTLPSLDVEPALYLFPLPGAYIGFCPIENGEWNCAGWMRQKGPIPQLPPPFSIPAKILQGQAPPFAFQRPSPKEGLAIGDALTSLPPATGCGLSVAFTSAYLACTHEAQQWHALYRSTYRTALLFHFLLTHPTLLQSVNIFSTFFPILSKKIYEKSRLKINFGHD